jgi:hypothetical protein
MGFTPFPLAKTAAGLAECGVGQRPLATKGSSSSSSSSSSSYVLSSDNSAANFPDGHASSTVPNVLPTGAVFCGRGSREGVLPRMLREILDTRFMVKRAAKRCLGPGGGMKVRSCRLLSRIILEHLQLARRSYHRSSELTGSASPVSSSART